jgi:hypothetical protein
MKKRWHAQHSVREAPYGRYYSGKELGHVGRLSRAVPLRPRGRTDGSGEPSYVRNFLAGVIPGHYLASFSPARASIRAR